MVGSSVVARSVRPSPIAAFLALDRVRSLSTLASADGTTMLVLENFHPYLRAREVIQALARQFIAGKQHHAFLIVLAPAVAILERISKPSQHHRQAGQLDEAVKQMSVILVTHDPSSKVVEPTYRAFDFPATAKAARLATVLSR